MAEALTSYVFIWGALVASCGVIYFAYDWWAAPDARRVFGHPTIAMKLAIGFLIFLLLVALDLVKDGYIAQWLLTTTIPVLTLLYIVSGLILFVTDWCMNQGAYQSALHNRPDTAEAVVKNSRASSYLLWFIALYFFYQAYAVYTGGGATYGFFH